MGRRVKFYLSSEYEAKLELLSRLLQCSRSEVLRRAIDCLLDRALPPTRPRGGEEGEQRPS